MVKRVVEAFACDICGGEGERYTVAFPDGTMALDRCDSHDKPIQKIRREKGTWTEANSTRPNNFKVSTVEEIQQQRLAALE